MILLGMILLFPLKVNAQTKSISFVSTSLNTTGNTLITTTFDGGTTTAPYGEYTVEFTALIFTDSYIKAIEINTPNEEYTCKIGSIPVDFQKDTGRSRWAYIISTQCEINRTGPITSIRFIFFSNGQNQIELSNKFTITNKNSNNSGTAIDYTTDIQEIITKLNNNNTWNNYLYNQLNENFPTIINALNQIHTDLQTQNTSVVNAINNNWQQFQNQDISQQDQTPPDTTTIDTVQQEESQQISDIQTAIQNIQAPTFDLTDFTLTFAWIWQTIIYLFTTHTILMSTMTIVLSLGFVKTIFGR